MFKSIFVPVDGSPTANQGLKQAIRLAKEQGATLTLLHVVDEGWTYRNMGVDGAAYYLDEVLRSQDIPRAEHCYRARPVQIARQRPLRTNETGRQAP